MSNRKQRKPDHKSGTKSGRYWMVGTHACLAALANPERRVHRIWCTENSALKLPENTKLQPEIVPGSQLARAVGEDTVHQGIALEVDPLEPVYLEDVARGDRPLILLDQVTDPHNVGAILRSAAAFNVGAVIMTKDHAATESATMAKAASGALDLVPLVSVTNLAQAIRELQEAGYWVLGLDGEATQELHSFKHEGKLALVLGAEGKGLRRLTGERCDMLVRLKMAPAMESLNVSNAAAIALYSLYVRRP